MAIHAQGSKWHVRRSPIDACSQTLFTAVSDVNHTKRQRIGQHGHWVGRYYGHGGMTTRRRAVRRSEWRALTELTAPALHLGHCHTVVGSGGHMFTSSPLKNYRLANMFHRCGRFPLAKCTNHSRSRHSLLPPILGSRGGRIPLKAT